MKKRLSFLAVIGILFSLPLFAQLSPEPHLQLHGNGGSPCAGCMLQTYLAGTSTPSATYNSSALNVANPTTITLNASGRPSNSGLEIPIYLGARSYKFVLKSQSGATIWTQDNVSDFGQLLKADLAGTSSGIGAALVGYKPTGGSARTVADKLGDIVNAKDYGATGDGVTDDTGALINAVAAAAGKMLDIPPGTYKTTQELLIGSGSTVQGHGATISCLLGATTHGSCVTLRGTNISIENLTIDATTTVKYGDGSDHVPLLIGNSSYVSDHSALTSNISVKNVKAIGSWDQGNAVMIFGAIQGVTLENVKAYSAAGVSRPGTGIQIHWDGNTPTTTLYFPRDITILNPYCESQVIGSSDASSMGIQVSGAYNVKIVNAEIKEFPVGIKVYTGSYGDSSGYFTAYDALMLASNVTIDAPAIYNFNVYGIYVTSGAGAKTPWPRGITVTNPRIYGKSTSTSIGIYAEYANGIEVTNPDITHCLYGIQGYSTTYDIHVTGGRIYACGYGILSGVNSYNLSVRKTRLYNITNEAIVGQAPTYNFEAESNLIGAASGETLSNGIRLDNGDHHGPKITNNHGFAASTAVVKIEATVDASYSLSGNSAETGVTIYSPEIQQTFITDLKLDKLSPRFLILDNTGTVYNWMQAVHYNVNGLEITPSTTQGGTTFTTPAVIVDQPGNLTLTGNIVPKNGTRTVYRCATAGTLPAGALTITSTDCGSTADAGLRIP